MRTRLKPSFDRRFAWLDRVAQSRLEQGIGREIGAPEARRRSIGEHQLVARNAKLPVLSRRLFGRIEETQVNRRNIGIKKIVVPGQVRLREPFRG